MRTVSGVLGLIALTATVYGQAFVHQKLGENFARIGTGILTESGLPFWSAEAISGNLDTFKITGNNNFTASLSLGSSRITDPIAYHPTAGLMWEGRGSALGTGNSDVFVEASNISASVLGSNRDAFGFGFTSAGQPIWYGSGSALGSGNLDIFRGSTNLTASVLGNNRSAVPMALNANDFLLWDGSGSNLGVNRDVFRTNLSSSTNTNLSQSPLGNNRYAIAVALNATNDAVWYGSGSANGDYNDVFFSPATGSTTNVSFPVIGGANINNPRNATVAGISGNNLAWQGQSASTGQFFDTFATFGSVSSNLSQTPLGTGRDSYPVDIEGQYVLWNGIGASTNNFDVFVSNLAATVTTRNLSQQRFGGGNTAGVREGNGVAVFANGNAFWTGKHSTTGNKYHLFHYSWSGNASVNLVREAVGNRDTEAIYLAHNGVEQVLWAVRDSTGTRYEVYLSTPRITTTLQGTVSISGFTGNPAQIALTIRQIDPYTGAVVATHTGNLSTGFNYSIAVTPGLYNGLRITAPRCLARNISGLRRLLGVTTLNFSLTLGDVNGDNLIDDADLLQVLFNFGASTTNPADLNGDGVVDDADLLIVLFNFGTRGD